MMNDNCGIMNEIKVAPSLLSADFGRLFSAVYECEQQGADYIHFDVMDAHFVPNLTFGPKLIKDCRNASKLPFDVHLMIDRPDVYLDNFIDAGADILTVHIESSCDILSVLKRIKKAGIRAGITLRPKTFLSEMERFYDYADLVLAMSVEPGFGGQKWIDGSDRRIAEIKEKREKLGLSFEIEVDGGIDDKTSRLAVSAGADVLVAGNFIFKHKSIGEAISKLKRLK